MLAVFEYRAGRVTEILSSSKAVKIIMNEISVIHFPCCCIKTSFIFFFPLHFEYHFLFILIITFLRMNNSLKEYVMALWEIGIISRDEEFNYQGLSINVFQFVKVYETLVVINCNAMLKTLT